MQIIALGTIRTFWECTSHRDAEQPLKSRYVIARRADWSTPQDIKSQFRSASIIGNNRVIFNIAGNKYRLIVQFNYPHRVGYIRFIGTHAQYDAVNVETV